MDSTNPTAAHASEIGSGLISLSDTTQLLQDRSTDFSPSLATLEGSKVLCRY